MVCQDFKNLTKTIKEGRRIISQFDISSLYYVKIILFPNILIGWALGRLKLVSEAYSIVIHIFCLKLRNSLTILSIFKSRRS